MSAGVLKIIALLAMLIDHLSAMLEFYDTTIFGSEILNFGRAIGRMALPIFAYFIVVGFYKTSNLKKYITRVHIIAIISQIPFFLAFFYNSIPNIESIDNFNLSYRFEHLIYISIIILMYWYYFLDKKYDNSLIWVSISYVLIPLYIKSNITIMFMDELNIFYELGFSLILIAMINKLKKFDNKDTKYNIFIIIFGILSTMYISEYANYKYFAILLVLALFYSRNNALSQSTIIAIWGCLIYIQSVIMIISVVITSVLLYFYNGKKGPRLKYLYYIFYPLHLSIISLFNIYLL